ncbi:hypothetical protein EMPG_15052 [Blastomyces silverae]|uniref:Uncharacterized protein n=1 Tax=Blastomyces silverae TaxID=2060906 RepID=A0A0H1BK28_9EURO|nr:hypothetical protein EMPG_15052 [Blastomyces silverae]
MDNFVCGYLHPSFQDAKPQRTISNLTEDKTKKNLGRFPESRLQSSYPMTSPRDAMAIHPMTSKRKGKRLEWWRPSGVFQLPNQR